MLLKLKFRSWNERKETSIRLDWLIYLSSATSGSLKVKVGKFKVCISRELQFFSGFYKFLLDCLTMDQFSGLFLPTPMLPGSDRLEPQSTEATAVALVKIFRVWTPVTFHDSLSMLSNQDFFLASCEPLYCFFHLRGTRAPAQSCFEATVAMAEEKQLAESASLNLWPSRCQQLDFHWSTWWHFPVISKKIFDLALQSWPAHRTCASSLRAAAGAEGEGAEGEGR